MPAQRKYPEPPVARHVKVIEIREDTRITVRGRERQHDVDGAFTRVDRVSMNAEPVPGGSWPAQCRSPAKPRGSMPTR